MSKKTHLNLVIKCNDCDFFFGKRKKTNFSCTRCGEIQINPHIVGRTNDTDELHRLVSLINSCPHVIHRLHARPKSKHKQNQNKTTKQNTHKTKNIIFDASLF